MSFAVIATTFHLALNPVCPQIALIQDSVEIYCTQTIHINIWAISSKIHHSTLMVQPLWFHSPNPANQLWGKAFPATTTHQTVWICLSVFRVCQLISNCDYPDQRDRLRFNLCCCRLLSTTDDRKTRDLCEKQLYLSLPAWPFGDALFEKADGQRQLMCDCSGGVFNSNSRSLSCSLFLPGSSFCA